jgi:hypothetical protein
MLKEGARSADLPDDHDDRGLGMEKAHPRHGDGSRKTAPIALPARGAV